MVSTPSPPPPCLPKITISSTPSTNPVVQRCFFTLAVSNKSQRPPPPPQDKNNPSAKKNFGGLGLGVLAAVKSNPQTKPFNNPPAQNNTAPIKTNPKQQQQQQEEGKPIGKEERELSGSDVLLALQRASAQKIKTKKRREYPSSSSLSSSTTKKRVAAAEVNYGDVRPICVKSEWITRVDELEKRLEELMDEVQ
ncbi:hypothetical protein RHGRI_001871 [Rhododendron griersonianum]|uniref:Uncharacterized protein n=1 Tax=Rhododendron griersonianum TaxID=479676 RepID=A0AAV6LLP5_9ERIC|nr:hypothetical protein RHGRI_001871 [Rhododendron griersonianum]